MTASAHESAVESYCPSCDTSYPEGLEVCPKDGDRLVRLASDPLLGKVIDGRFAIKSRVGSGGMGVVYRADQASIRRDVAIKVIHSRHTQGASIAKRFLREARLCSRLTQANIVTVLDFGQSEDGLLFLVMELLEGRTLGAVLAEEGPFPVKRLVRVGVQLCEALEAAHEASIVHRDLKPSNVVVLDKPEGRDYLKVLDFGLAKSLADDANTALTHSDAILGTPAYISPEAVRGEAIDERSDLYAVGVMLYELLCGRLPFNAGTATDMLSRHVFEAPHPIPDAVDPRVSSLIERLLAKNPADRIGSARELLDALEALRDIDDPALPWPAVAPPAPIAGTDSTMASDRGSAPEAMAETGVVEPEEPAARPVAAQAPPPARRGTRLRLGIGLGAAMLVAALVVFGARVALTSGVAVDPPRLAPEPEPPVTEPPIAAIDAGAPVLATEDVDAAPKTKHRDPPRRAVQPDDRTAKPKVQFLEENKP